MPNDLPFDSLLVQRFPLPLAQLYRRAYEAVNELERHQASFYLWEAGLKLLGVVAIVEYDEQDPVVAERLRNLARPSLGHWREFVRLLVPRLADRGDAHFGKLRELLHGRARDDLPAATGLDSLLRKDQEGKTGARSSVSVGDLLDRLVTHRNRHIGHAGLGDSKFYGQLADALLPAALEVFGGFDPLAGRKLIYVAEVKEVSGRWAVQRLELVGERGHKLPSLEIARDGNKQPPSGERVYLDGEAGLKVAHPLLFYDASVRELLFLNSRRGRRRAEYLCYTNNRIDDKAELGGDQCQLLAKVLGLPEVEAGQAAAWAERAEADEPQTTDRPQGSYLGEFKLITELGRGGMGVVYRAEQQALRRQVAVKELMRRGDAKEWTRQQTRFRREVRALGRVQHPHLVRIHSEGKEGDHWFYVMELIEGASLAKIVERLTKAPTGRSALTLGSWQAAVNTACEQSRREERPLEDGAGAAAAPLETPSFVEVSPDARGGVRQVTELLRQVSEAVHALHEEGIVHRDIKPGNIMVKLGGTDAVLMDLGVAQWSDGEAERVTTGRDIPGTLRYASPEQVLARGLVDRRSDVYSLGATLWELLTLRPLYGSTEKTDAELIRSIQFEDPGSMRVYNAAVPADVEAIVAKCLEKDARKRYATAHELAEDLRRFLDGKPVQARLVKPWERAWKWVLRHKAAAAIFGLLFMVLFLGLIGGSMAWLWLDARTARDQNVETNKDLATKNGLLANLLQINQATEKQLSLTNGDLEQAKAQLANFLYLDRVSFAWKQWDAGDYLRAVELLDSCEEKYRNWEWYHLKLKTSLLYTLAGHQDKLEHVSYSPDGKWLASASRDGTVRLWDSRSGKNLKTLTGHKDWVRDVCFSPDGRFVASASADGTVKLWDAQSGTDIASLTGHKNSVEQVAFSPDGKYLASASEDRTVKLWDVQTHKEIASLEGHLEGVRHVSFSPDGLSLASASSDGTVKLWDARSAKELFTLAGHKQAVRYVAYSPDSQRVASASSDGTVKLWEASSGTEVATLLGHKAAVAQVSFSPDGLLLASASLDGTLKLWDARSGKNQASLVGHKDAVRYLSFGPDGKRLASASADDTVKLWDVASGAALATLAGHKASVICVAFSPDGKQLASASWDGTAKLWDASVGKESLTLTGHKANVADVSFSPNGLLLASASWDRTVKLWDAKSGQELAALRGHKANVVHVTFSPNSQRLASASNDKTVRLWDSGSNKEVAVLAGHKANVVDVTFSADGRKLASASDDRTVRIWDVSTGKELFTLAGHLEAVKSVSFSPDGQRLASASHDGTVKLWDVVGGKELITLTGHDGPVQQVSFSPTGRFLASASSDKTVKLWDVASGKLLRTLEGHKDVVNLVKFSHNEDRLASVSSDGTVKLWDVHSAAVIATLGGQQTWLEQVAFSPDSERLATASNDGTVKLWDGRSGKELATIAGPQPTVRHLSFSPDGQTLAAARSDGGIKLWFSKRDADASENPKNLQSNNK